MEKKPRLLEDDVIWEISYDIVDSVIEKLSREEIYNLAEKGWRVFSENKLELPGTASSFLELTKDVAKYSLKPSIEKILAEEFGEGGKLSEDLKAEQEKEGKIKL